MSEQNYNSRENGPCPLRGISRLYSPRTQGDVYTILHKAYTKFSNSGSERGSEFLEKACEELVRLKEIKSRGERLIPLDQIGPYFNGLVDDSSSNYSPKPVLRSQRMLQKPTRH